MLQELAEFSQYGSSVAAGPVDGQSPGSVDQQNALAQEQPQWGDNPGIDAIWPDLMQPEQQWDPLYSPGVAYPDFIDLDLDSE